MVTRITQFDVFLVNLDPTRGAEMKKTRPAAVLSPDAMNKNLGTVLIAPLTSTAKSYPSRVLSNFGGNNGEIALDQIRAIDKKRLVKKLGSLDGKTSGNIKKILATMFS